MEINIEEYMPLAKSVASKCFNRTRLKEKSTFEDVLQTCYLQLVKCVSKFDETKGWSFSTYAYNSMEKRCYALLRDDRFYPHSRNDKASHGNTFESLDRPIGEDQTPLGHMFGCEDDFTDLDFKLFMNGLSKKEKQIVMLKMNGKTQMEIAEILNISQCTVSRTLIRLKKILKGTFEPKTSVKSVSERSKKMWELYKEGMPQRQIARKLCVSQAAVSQALKKLKQENSQQ